MLSERGIILETYIERESNRAGESATVEVQEVVSKLYAAVIHSCIDAVSYTHLTLPTIYSV